MEYLALSPWYIVFVVYIFNLDIGVFRKLVSALYDFCLYIEYKTFSSCVSIVSMSSYGDSVISRMSGALSSLVIVIWLLLQRIFGKLLFMHMYSMCVPLYETIRIIIRIVKYSMLMVIDLTLFMSYSILHEDMHCRVFLCSCLMAKYTLIDIIS